MPKKKTSRRSSEPSKPAAGGKKYGQLASKKVERAMHEFKQGELKSGRSGKTVTNPKQAVAIGLSEARKKGGKVPPARTSP